jgi:hypothetical protein
MMVTTNTADDSISKTRTSYRFDGIYCTESGHRRAMGTVYKDH